MGADWLMCLGVWKSLGAATATADNLSTRMVRVLRYVAFAVVTFSLLSLAHANAQEVGVGGGDRRGVQPPSGYRFPTEADFTDDWKEYRSENPMPFHDTGDFNGDGVLDDVWIFPAIAGKTGFGVFAFIASRSGAPTVIRLTSARNEAPQWYGVGTVEPGSYETACGKGYWQCKKGEPEKLNLTADSIEFYRIEGAGSVFWWDANARRFQRTWTSD